MSRQDLITADVWQPLRTATSARIALGRVGGSLPTQEWLDFRSAHAAARDAVHQSFDAEDLARKVKELGVETIVVSTMASDRQTFLQWPGWGRRLAQSSAEQLQKIADRANPRDLAIVVSDGLSALAVSRQVVPLLERLLPRLAAEGWQLAPLTIVRFGRVAIEDEVGQLLSSQLALMLIGERPGLCSPDSLGAYLVYGPRIGNTDANRNCVSNIRPEGLNWDAAVDTLLYLLTESRRRKLSGVELKDERRLMVETRSLPDAGGQEKFRKNAPLLHKTVAQNQG